MQMLLLVTHTMQTRLTRTRDERGDGAVPWLIVIGFGIGIAYYAGDSVYAFAKNVVAGLGAGLGLGD